MPSGFSVMLRLVVSGTVYALADPSTGEVRYVGATTKEPRIRLSGHMADARQPSPERVVSRWIKKLAETPDLVVLEKADDVYEAEERWIAHYREQGARLCNVAPGGRGFHRLGVPVPEETRRKISAARKGKAASVAQLRAGREHSERMKGEGNSFYGRTHSKETRARISAASGSRRHSDESKQKIGGSLRANTAARGFHVSSIGRERIAISKRELWADPEWRARQIEAVRAGTAKKRAV